MVRATPVLILSALGETDHKVEGLRAGGDDYLAKPYSLAFFWRNSKADLDIRSLQ